MAGMVLPLLELTYQYRTSHGQYFWACAPAYTLQPSISNPQTNASISLDSPFLAFRRLPPWSNTRLKTRSQSIDH